MTILSGKQPDASTVMVTIRGHSAWPFNCSAWLPRWRDPQLFKDNAEPLVCSSPLSLFKNCCASYWLRLGMHLQSLLLAELVTVHLAIHAPALGKILKSLNSMDRHRSCAAQCSRWSQTQSFEGHSPARLPCLAQRRSRCTVLEGGSGRVGDAPLDCGLSSLVILRALLQL